MATIRAGISDISNMAGSGDRRLAKIISIRSDNDTAGNLGPREDSSTNVVRGLLDSSGGSAGSEIKARRLSLGWTQKQLAEVSGYTNGWISVIERDIERPTRQFLIDIEIALGVPLGTWSREWKDQRKVGDVGDKLMTPTEVSRYLGVSRGVVYSYIHRYDPVDDVLVGIYRNKLSVVFVDNYMRVAIRDLARWVCVEDGTLLAAENSGCSDEAILELILQEEQAIRKWLNSERSTTRC